LRRANGGPQGWWPTLFGALSAVQVATLDRRITRSVRPERYVAASFMWTAVFAAAGAATSGGPRSPLLFLVALPGDPSLVIVACTLVTGVVIFTLSLSDTEMALRADARIDHLTGLFNRSSLKPRFDELRSQARVTGGAIALVVYDLDCFKAVNDDLGHDRGDAVLRDTAMLLRRHLRAFDLVYRLGGEEFAVVLPGVGVAEATEIAQRQRESIEEARPGGVAITISGGVASARGAAVAWETLFQRADAALLRAKREGRNRIAVAGDEVPDLDAGVALDPGAELLGPPR
jgi:diguanylate cyclase (GGDEF)-like protein